MTDELAHCPFCGGHAVIEGGSESARGRCLDCGAQGALSFLEGDDSDACEAQAVSLWNRRVFPVVALPPPPPPPPTVRVYARNPGGPLEAFDAAPPINAAVHQVVCAGFRRAMVLVK